MKFYIEGEIIKNLRERLDAADGDRTKFAAKIGFSLSYINMVLGGQRPVTEQLASSLGFKECPRRFTRKQIKEPKP